MAKKAFILSKKMIDTNLNNNQAWRDSQMLKEN